MTISNSVNKLRNEKSEIENMNSLVMKNYNWVSEFDKIKNY